MVVVAFVSGCAEGIFDSLVGATGSWLDEDGGVFAVKGLLMEFSGVFTCMMYWLSSWCFEFISAW